MVLAPAKDKRSTSTVPKRTALAKAVGKGESFDLEQELPASFAAQVNSELDAVLLKYQRDWCADDSELKIAEKSRRVGLTWAEASDNVLTAAMSRQAGGMNVYYIGYNMDMAIEYIEACAMWARVFNQAAEAIEEGEEVFNDGNDERSIKTYTIRFASGHRIVALSSRPANLRGKQGVVVIDEAAFHGALDELLKAALALLIWGGKVRIISTHDGDQNPFNELINMVRAGKRKGTIHRITFRDAVEQGLFGRVCMRKGVPWSEEAQAKWIADVYAFYGDAAEEELDVVPSQGSGAWLSTSLIEARMYDAPVLRYTAEQGFEQLPDEERYRVIKEWLDEKVGPLLKLLVPGFDCYFGQDFARTGDLTVMVPAQVEQNLRRRIPFLLELRNMPHKQQFQIAEYIIDGFPRFMKAAVDARGNGHAVSEFLAQKYGYNRVDLVMLTEGWYREQMPPMKAAFEDDTIAVPRDKDALQDLRSIKVIKGVARIPDKKTTGGDGTKRHGDVGIAIALMHYASRQDVEIIAYRRVLPHAKDMKRDIKRGAGWRSKKGIW
jgi:Mu-like prophage FluMu protein gp28